MNGTASVGLRTRNDLGRCKAQSFDLIPKGLTLPLMQSAIGECICAAQMLKIRDPSMPMSKGFRRIASGLQIDGQLELATTAYRLVEGIQAQDTERLEESETPRRREPPKDTFPYRLNID